MKVLKGKYLTITLYKNLVSDMVKLELEDGRFYGQRIVHMDGARLSIADDLEDLARQIRELDKECVG